MSESSLASSRGSRARRPWLRSTAVRMAVSDGVVAAEL